jgi:twitching motility protein PilT
MASNEEFDLASFIAPREPSKSQTPHKDPSSIEPAIRIRRNDEPSIDLDGLLRYMSSLPASDLHLSVGSKPLVRHDGEITPVDHFPTLTRDALLTTFSELLPSDQFERFLNEYELDFAHHVPGLGRFRVNLFMQRGNPGSVFRLIPEDILPLDKLKMPTSLYTLAALPRGLVLVTGPTGSGKSTTLASLIDHANRTRKAHIMTIEDPIEFIHPNHLSVVNQREIGADTKSFSAALKHVLRQDPDIILIGELRDLETISTALTAAETGHLVFATLHTQSAQDTINRIIDVFSADQQDQIKAQLAAVLRGVVCQTLIKRADGNGRVVATEVMIVDTGIAQMVRRGETHQIPSALQAGGVSGMHTLNQSLAELVNNEIIERETAEEYTNDSKDLANLIKRRRPGSLSNGIGSLG